MTAPPSATQTTALKSAFESLLGTAPWLSTEIPPGEWNVFSQKLFIKSLRDGEVLQAMGDRNLVGAFVLSGCIRTAYLHQDGAEHNRFFAAAGQFVGPLAAGLVRGPSEASLVAIGDTDVIAVDLYDFLAMYQVSPVWDRIGRGITERFYLIRERHAHQLLTLSAEERWTVFKSEYSALLSLVPQKHIASYLGIRPETLARLRKART